MPGRNQHTPTWRDELHAQTVSLDKSCRRHLGVSIAVFRTAKFIFYMAVLAFTAYLIEFQSVEAILAMTFAALLITGPEGVEALLIRNDVIEDTTMGR